MLNQKERERKGVNQERRRCGGVDSRETENPRKEIGEVSPQDDGGVRGVYQV